MSAGRFLFVTWSGGGNVPPTVTLARRLQARGHHVRVFGPPELDGRFASAAVPFRAFRGDTAWGSGLAHDVRAEAEREATDVAIVDYMQPMALCGAEAAGVRVVALVHTLYTGVALGEFSPMRMATRDADVAAVRDALGLAPVAELTDLLVRADRTLVCTTRAFDGPVAPDPANLRYVGPIVEDAGPDAGWRPPWPDEASLVHVTLGSTPMDEGPLLQTVLAALEVLPVHVFATVGAHLEPQHFRVPANAIVARAVRHAALLLFADAFVTHAGLGGVGAALTYGVPMLCIPLGREQPVNAARVEAIGAGRTLGLDATVADLRGATNALLGDATYREAARSAAAEIRTGGSGTRAVEELETLLA